MTETAISKSNRLKPWVVVVWMIGLPTLAVLLVWRGLREGWVSPGEALQVIPGFAVLAAAPSLAIGLIGARVLRLIGYARRRADTIAGFTGGIWLLWVCDYAMSLKLAPPCPLIDARVWTAAAVVIFLIVTVNEVRERFRRWRAARAARVAEAPEPTAHTLFA
jgi:hypothetical protein